MAFIVAIAKFQVKHARNGIAKLGGESTRKKIGVGQVAVVDNAHRPTRRSGNGKVIRIRDTHTFQPPEYALWRISPDNDVIAGIISPLYPGKVGRHPGRFAPTTGVAVGLVDGKLPRRHYGHVIPCFARSLRPNGYGRQLLHALFQFNIQDRFPTGIHNDVVEQYFFVPHQGNAHRPSAYGDASDAIVPRTIGQTAHLYINRLHRSTHQRIF